MTDKELRKLKRSELLELMFYLREELDKLKEENNSLKIRMDDLTRTAVESKNIISDEMVKTVSETVRNTLDSYFSEKHQQIPECSNNASAETEQ